MAPSSLFYVARTWIVFLVMIHTSLAKPSCHLDERSALMEFKGSFRINRTDCVYPKIESWLPDGSGDCCSWDGVGCDEATGHVTSLDLSNSCLVGIISLNTSLFRLRHLESLNLAWNNFNSSLIPYGFGNLSRLQHLDFSNSNFLGKVPSDISLLSKLTSLDLSCSWWGSLEMPDVDNFIRNLTMLRELDLSYTIMSSPFPHVLANFTSLESLQLQGCELQGEFPISIFQLPNLEVLDIYRNANLSGFIPELHWGNRLKSLSLRETNFSGEIPASIGNLILLNELSIYGCHFSGSLPTSLGNLSQLTSLAIGYNKFHGQIPTSFANLTQLSLLEISANNLSGDIWHWFVSLSKLTYLSAADAQLSGPIPSSIKNLTRLVALGLSQNNLQGEIPNSLWELEHLEHLSLTGNKMSGTVDYHKLKNLRRLGLGSNNISFVSETEKKVMLPKLFILALGSCNLHEFPKFLSHLNGLELLDLSHNKFEGSFPTWIGNGSRESLRYLDLSHNFLKGFVNNRINLQLPKLTYLDISSNSLKIELPIPPPSVIYYNVSNNFLFGGLQSICGAKSLLVLDLSKNSLNDTIPPCIGNTDSLPIANFGKSKVEGMINHANPQGCALRFIDLMENRLQGPVPRSLTNCAKLEYLDLGYNQIIDVFPLWLSNLIDLQVLVLKSNKFYGPIETYRSKFNLNNLHIMDISKNNFNGELPRQFIQSFHAMKVPATQESLEYMAILSEYHFVYGLELMNKGAEREYLNDPEQVFFYGGKLVNKGVEREYLKVPVALMLIDLSSNKFEGHIPNLIGDLKSLVSLNLSNNIFSGFIPPSLANLTMLESLDLSQNNLSGEIPRHLAKLTYLSAFNVSHNQLSGPIPQGTQFSTFSTNSFSMNDGLCGSPLPKKCTTAGDNLPLQPSPSEESGDESLFNLDWKIVIIGSGVGFFIGFLLGNFIIDEKSGWFLHFSKEMTKILNRARRH